MALYTDTAGSPDALVVATGSNPVVDGLQQFPVSATLVPAGTYWLMAVYSSMTNVAVTFGGLTPSKYRNQPFGDPLPDPFGVASDNGTQSINYFATVLQ